MITFIGHGTLMIEAGKTVVHIDPVSQYTDYSILPKGDLILITHEHGDHPDKKALALITKPQTNTVVSKSCSGLVNHAIALVNGDTNP